MKMHCVPSSERLIVLTVIALACIFSRTNAQQSPVNFRFINSANGYAVLLPHVVLQNRNSANTIEFKRNTPLNLALNLESGVWDISVQAGGFQSISSHIAVSANASSTIEFFLDPIVPPPELIAQNIVALHTNDATVVVGFIVDDESGLPLANVSIRSTGTDVHVKSDERGFYKLHLPVTSGTTSSRLEFRQSGFRSEVRENIEVWPNGDWIYNLRMKRGSGENSIDESKINRQQIERDLNCDNRSGETRNLDTLLSSVVLPATIRVGRSCTGTSCTLVQVYSLQTYVKYVLPAEWFPCWGSIGNNGLNSLEAGAVAIRSYALWHVYNPLSATYDICDNIFCQVFGSLRSTNTNSAVDATAYTILTDAGNANVMRAEYAAENNNKGCGDGFAGTGSTWPCIADMPCLGQTSNGHGRGVCQWGTIRWASGTRVLPSAPCSAGVPHRLGTLSWQEILAHYYPAYTLAQGSTATIESATPNPGAVARGTTFTIQATVRATDSLQLILSASITPAGTTIYTTDPAHDVKLKFSSGASTVARLFTVPPTQTFGMYDLLVSLWFDKNNNGTLDAGDFSVNSGHYDDALTITPLTSAQEQTPTAFRLFQNYPNPFNPTTEIRYQTSELGYVTLKVFDILGRVVATLVNEEKTAGIHTITWDASGVASGVYMYKLVSSGMNETKRLVLLR